MAGTRSLDRLLLGQRLAAVSSIWFLGHSTGAARVCSRFISYSVLNGEESNVPSALFQFLVQHRFASLAPANAASFFASAFAAFWSLLVFVNGAAPSPIGETQTTVFAF